MVNVKYNFILSLVLINYIFYVNNRNIRYQKTRKNYSKRTIIFSLWTYYGEFSNHHIKQPFYRER